MRFVDGADERELMSMVSAKNPYSFMALAKLQSIRDLKLKEQAGQPNPPPMSEQIPQQLAQLASGQPMQQPMQPMQQQPMQPMQQQGIASIGGEATGAGGGMVSFTDGGGVRRFAAGGVKDNPFMVTFNDALEKEGVLGTPLEPVVRSLFQQESSSGADTRTSNAGAVGAMQILPRTFASVADKDWDIKDPSQNMRAGIRYAGQMFKLANGDPSLTAAGYYGGPRGLAKARQGIAVSDTRNPNAPNTLQYGQQVANRIPVAENQIPRARIPDRQLTTAENVVGYLTGSGSAYGATSPSGEASIDERPDASGIATATGVGLAGAEAIRRVNANRAADLIKYNAQQSMVPTGAPPPKPPITVGSATQSTLSGIKNVGSGITNAGKFVGKFVGKTPVAIAGYSAIADTLPTPTEDFYTRFGIERSNSGPKMEAAKDIGVRALGLGSDMFNNMTLGTIERFFADKYDQNTGQKVTAKKAKQLAVIAKEEAKKDVDKPKVDIAETQEFPAALDPALREIFGLRDQQNAALKEIGPAREALSTALEKRIADSRLNVQDFDIAKGDLKADRTAIVKEYETLFPNPNTELRKQLNELQKAHTQSSEQAPYQALLKFSLGLMANKNPRFGAAIGEAGQLGLEEYSRLQGLNQRQKEKLFESEAHLANANDLRSQNQYAMADKEARLAQSARLELFQLKHDEKVSNASLVYQVAQIKAGVPEERARMLGQQLTANLNIYTTMKGPEQFQMFKLLKENSGFADYMQDIKEMDYFAKVAVTAQRQVDENLKIQAAAGVDISKINIQDEVQRTIESAMRSYKAYQAKQAESKKPPVPVTGK